MLEFFSQSFAYFIAFLQWTISINRATVVQFIETAFAAYRFDFAMFTIYSK